jgi:hypothetical protein
MVVINTTGCDQTVILTQQETVFMIDTRIRDTAKNIIHIDEIGDITLVKMGGVEKFIKKNAQKLGIKK